MDSEPEPDSKPERDSKLPKEERYYTDSGSEIEDDKESATGKKGHDCAFNPALIVNKKPNPTLEPVD